MSSHHEIEKEHDVFEHNDEARAVASRDDSDADHGFTEAEQKAIISRVDRRLVVTLGAMYCVSLMDRTNLSAAAIAGMTVELQLNLYDRYVGGLFAAFG